MRREGVILARELNFRRAQIETDSQEMVKLWEMGELQRSCISPIIREIRDLSASFLDFSLVYVNRDCNSVAHTLAKQVSESNQVGEWQLAKQVPNSSPSKLHMELARVRTNTNQIQAMLTLDLRDHLG
jgi:hypothetical protein